VRILYHHRTRSHDGQRVHIEGLVDALRRAGHEVAVVGPPDPAGRRASSDGAGPPRASRLRELAELAYNGVERARLRAAARAFRPDAVYARHALYCASAVAFARRLRVPVVVEVNAPLALERERHGGLAFPRFARRHETATLNRADRVVAVTRVLADLLAAQGVAREKIDVHWNGLEPGALAEADGAPVRARLGLDGRLVLGFVGFVRDWNRLERAFPFLARHAEATLLVVGEGPDRPRLEALARERGVAGRVRFLGTLARDAVLAHVAAFDVALLPEVTEYASPLKLLDYFAAGRAVVAPDRANLREVVEPGGNALLFEVAPEGSSKGSSGVAPEGSSDGAFDAALEKLAASPELRTRIGAAGRATLARHGLTWDANAAKVVARFSELRGTGSGR
jgi:glycosyltransferase involved in cell wall biosynthesis